MNYLLLQIIALVFVLFSLSRVILRYNKNKTKFRETLFWVILWIAAVLIIIFPDIMSLIAKDLGVSRGVDIIIYFSIMILFYLNFKGMIRDEKVEQDISKIVKEITLRKKWKEF